MVELAKGFKEEGHEVTFLTYHNINFFKSELDKNDIIVTTILEANYLKRLYKVRKEIRIQRPDAVLSFLQAANLMATIAGFPYRRWKLIVGERSANPKIVTSIKLRFYRKLYFFADYVVGNSYENIKLVKQIIPCLRSEKLKVIYNIVNIASTENQPLFENEKTKIVIAASYRAVKNLEGLITAVSMLSNQYKQQIEIDWYGEISMDKRYFDENQERIIKMNLQNTIRLNDKTDQIIQKYQTADFIGLFSHYEGFPNIICEAMAMSKPVIVSKVSDVPLFVKDSFNGFLCDSKNPESIKEAIIKAIKSSSEERRNMAVSNYFTARKVFNKDIIVAEYLKLLIDGK